MLMAPKFVILSERETVSIR